MTRSQKIAGSVATILLSAVVALLLSAVAAYAFWQWFSHSGEMGDKEKYAAIQSIEVEHKGKFDGRSLLLRDVGQTHMTLLGISGDTSGSPVVWVVLNQLSHDGRVMMVPEGATLRRDCGQLADLLKREDPIPEVATRLRKEMKCSALAITRA